MTAAKIMKFRTRRAYSESFSNISGNNKNNGLNKATTRIIMETSLQLNGLCIYRYGSFGIIPADTCGSAVFEVRKLIFIAPL